MTAEVRHRLPLETLFVLPHPVSRRALDIALSATALILLAPLLLAIALAIKLTLPGPVFFMQERTGQSLRRFKMYKFRTMVVGAQGLRDVITRLNEMSGPLVKISNDPRVTKVGRILRKTSLDELPQLLNVLKGDMTLIGPRALSPLPTQYETWQRRRFAVRPGLACLWQVEKRECTDFVEWMRSDIRYLRVATLLSDIRVLGRVMVRVATCKGAR